jgi:hypothetical protein
MPVTTASDVETSRAGLAGARLAVAWQHPDSRLIEPVGLLTCHEDGYQFGYLARATDVPGFQAFIGFPDLQRTYRSERLFPLFSQRIMRSSRADFARYVGMLGLDGAAQPWELLARSMGERQGDAIRLYAEPFVAPDGATDTSFFVSGVRYRLMEDPRVAGVLARLTPGNQLQLAAQPDNPQNPLALHVTETAGLPLGWVPNVLLQHVRSVRDPAVLVQQVGDDETVPAYRLLVRLTGWATAGRQPFDGPEWRRASA